MFKVATIAGGLTLAVQGYSYRSTAKMAVAINGAAENFMQVSSRSQDIGELYVDPEEDFPEDCGYRFSFETLFSPIPEVDSNGTVTEWAQTDAVKKFINGEGVDSRYSKDIHTPICKDNMKIYPMWEVSDGEHIERQIELCEALCATEPECRSYTQEWKYDSNGRMLVKSTACNLCRASFPEKTPYKNFEAAEGKNGTFYHTAYKVKDDWSTGKRETTPCLEDDECALETTGMGNKEICDTIRNVDDPDSVYYDYTSGSQGADSDAYMTICELAFIKTVLTKKRFDLNCVNAKSTTTGVTCEFIASKNWQEAIVSSSTATSASRITKPFCRIPLRHANKKDFDGTTDAVDCRDRSTIYSRVTNNTVTFDCSTVLDPTLSSTAERCASSELIDDVATVYCCDTPLWNTHFVLNARQNYVDLAEKEFQHETIKQWCPNTCNDMCFPARLAKAKPYVEQEKQNLPDAEMDVVNALRSRTAAEYDVMANETATAMGPNTLSLLKKNSTNADYEEEEGEVGEVL